MWAEELAQILLKDDRNGEDEHGAELMMSPVRALARDAKGKVVRARARDCVSEWELLKADGMSVPAVGGEKEKDGDEDDGKDVKEDGEEVEGEDSEEWSGFGD